MRVLSSIKKIKITKSKLGNLLGLKPLSKSRLFISSTLIIFVLIFGVYGILSVFNVGQSPKKITEKDMVAQILSLRNANDCKKGLSSLQGASPDPQKKDYSIALLAYKADCQQELAQFSVALVTLDQLAKYYKDTGKNEELTNTIQQINTVKETIAYNQKNPSNASHQVDPKVKAPDKL